MKREKIAVIKDLFKREENKLFGDSTIDERRYEVSIIMKNKRKEIYELSKGKNFVEINAAQAYLYRLSGMKERYKFNVVI